MSDFSGKQLALHLEEPSSERADVLVWEDISSQSEDGAGIMFCVIARDERPYMAELIQKGYEHGSPQIRGNPHNELRGLRNG